MALDDAAAVPLHCDENVALSNALQEEDCSMQRVVADTEFHLCSKHVENNLLDKFKFGDKLRELFRQGT